MAPAKTKPMPYSHHLAFERAEASNFIVIGNYLNTIAQVPSAKTAQTTGAEVVVVVAEILFLTIRRLQKIAYRQKAVAPRIIDLASMAA
ncbi:MAG TPA: hypothetical protein VGP19_03415 [Candidatus Acidoferrales bacterium]|jgi:hypothetical protein|nr:hypothetical protein [Candidatus Acidoferrales bacterium]